MDSKKSSFEAYLQKMQRHFEQNSKIREVQAHSSKVGIKFSFLHFNYCMVFKFIAQTHVVKCWEIKSLGLVLHFLNAFVGPFCCMEL